MIYPDDEAIDYEYEWPYEDEWLEDEEAWLDDFDVFDL